MLVFINYWIEKCTVKHWNPFFLIFRDSPGFMGFKGPCPGIGSVLRMSCRDSKSKNMTFLIMRTHILTFPQWDEISIAVEQPSASQWQQEQERERKMCGLVIVEWVCEGWGSDMQSELSVWVSDIFLNIIISVLVSVYITPVLYQMQEYARHLLHHAHSMPCTGLLGIIRGLEL